MSVIIVPISISHRPEFGFYCPFVVRRVTRISATETDHRQRHYNHCDNGGWLRVDNFAVTDRRE